MANTIIHKKSSVSGKTPLTTDLALGEIAVNTYDGKIYIKKNDGAESIVEFSPGGKVYNHTQASASTTWTINHNLNERLVDVIVSDSTYVKIVPDEVTFTSVNQVTLKFFEAVSGYAKVIG